MLIDSLNLFQLNLFYFIPSVSKTTLDICKGKPFLYPKSFPSFFVHSICLELNCNSRRREKTSLTITITITITDQQNIMSFSVVIEIDYPVCFLLCPLKHAHDLILAHSLSLNDSQRKSLLPFSNIHNGCPLPFSSYSYGRVAPMSI